MFHKTIIVDGEEYTERGCEGPCFCTGRCKELIPMTDLHRLENKQHHEMQNFLTCQVVKGFMEN